MSCEFVHLHVHSTHSYMDGFGTPAHIAAHAKEAGFKAIALTDHGNVDGAIPFYFECKKQGIKPILGVEAYITNKLHLKEKSGTNPIKHVTLLAKTALGYENICKLLTKAWCEGFYHRPRIDWEHLLAHKKDLIVLSGCPNSAVYDDLSLLKKLKKEFKGDFYFELVCTPEPEGYTEKAKAAYKEAIKLGIKPVITGDVHYPKQEHAKVQKLIFSINNIYQDSTSFKEEMRDYYWLRDASKIEKDCLNFHPWTSCMMIEEMKRNTLEIADKVNISFDKSIPVVYDAKSSKPPMARLSKLVVDGVKAGRVKKWSAIYSSRLERELKLIREKGFADYFLVVADLINWAKSKSIMVGPARGSSAGSLVCYLLGITEIDPIPHGLVFERFIDVTRSDPPDIDTDFEDARRDDVIAYLTKKYEHVGVLSAWSQWRAKSCLWDVARINEIPGEAIKAIIPHIIEREAGDARASMTLEDTFAEVPEARAALAKYPELRVASMLESQVRQKTRHAAGVLISSEPVTKFASVYEDGCLSIDGNGCKLLGGLKLDVLGINTLTIISKCLQAIKERHGLDIDIYRLELDDDNVFQNFRNRLLSGIFQYEGGAMRELNRQVPVRSFNDIVVANAASRPGPLHSGCTATYIKRLNGEPVTYDHPIIKEITKETFGVILYQEQVMAICKKLGLMSDESTNSVRKLISKSKGAEALNKLYDEFKTGCQKNGVTETRARKLWDQVLEHGAYSFNKSHAVSYSALSYWTMWLKTYYTPEFFWAMIAYCGNDDHKQGAIREWKRTGGKLLQVHASKSQAVCNLEGDEIRMGWMDVGGIGESVAEKLTSNAPYKSTADLVDRAKISKNTLHLLEELGIVKRMQLDMFKGDHTPPEQGLLYKHCPWLHDLDLSEHRSHDCQFLEDLDAPEQQRPVSVVGVIKEVELKDWKGSAGMAKFANMILEDETDSMMVTFSRKSYNQWQKLIWLNGGVGNIVLIRGVMLPDSRRIFGNLIKVVGRMS